MVVKHYNRTAVITFTVFFGWLLLMWPLELPAVEQGGAEKKPERLIQMAAEFPGVKVPVDDDVSLDLIFHNRGRSHENVEVAVAEKPDKWQARIKTYKYSVTGIHVPAGEDKTLTFSAQPEKGVTPGKYQFLIKAQTVDGQFKMSQRLAVEVVEKESVNVEAKGVKLTTSYPVLKGPSDAKFEFSIEVDSKLDKDAVFDLFAQGPSGWEMNFKPAYEDKYISSLRIKANQSETLAIQVKPPANTKAGEYPVNIRVHSGQAKAEARLMVILTGTYNLEVGTATGLLSLEARQGNPANLSFYIKNTGSAANNGVKFMTFKPENWKVEFKPKKIESVEPGGVNQVDVFITPNDEALVGDYSVNVQVEGEKASKSLELRVTVKASTAWGWIGIGIIILVVGGLIGLFRWLGRR